MPVRLSLMLFLQYFVWGAWYVTVGNFMSTVGMQGQIYWAYTVGPIAAVVSPFFLGMVADRYFSAEKVLGILSIIGGLSMYGAAVVGGSHPLVFILLLLLHSLCYAPTIGLSNSLAFHHISNREKQFPIIRAFGSVGWITAGVIVSGILSADTTALPLKWAAGASILYGLYSFTLPHTPPQSKSKSSFRQILGLDALAQLKSKSFIVFISTAVVLAIPVAAFNAYAPVFVSSAGLEDPAFKLSFGQMSEVLVMFLMPLVFLRLRFKAIYIIGLAMWSFRYLLFAIAPSESGEGLIMTSILIHGICFDFIYIAGRIYVDRKATPEIRSQAHGLLVVISMGIGQLIGAPISGWMFNSIVGDSAEAMWPIFWGIPALICFLAMIFFWILFDDE